MSLEEPEDFPHALRFPLVNNQPSTGRIDVVAEHGRAAHSFNTDIVKADK